MACPKNILPVKTELNRKCHETDPSSCGVGTSMYVYIEYSYLMLIGM